VAAVGHHIDFIQSPQPARLEYELVDTYSFYYRPEGGGSTRLIGFDDYKEKEWKSLSGTENLLNGS
jgi:hypothetical protein